MKLAIIIAKLFAIVIKLFYKLINIKFYYYCSGHVGAKASAVNDVRIKKH